MTINILLLDSERNFNLTLVLTIRESRKSQEVFSFHAHLHVPPPSSGLLMC